MLRRIDQTILLASRLMARAPGNTLLASGRARKAELLRDRFRAQVELLQPGLEAGSGEAREALARLAEQALAQMRAELEGAREGSVQRLLAKLDTLWRSSTATEHIDDPSLDERVRARAMGNLDGLNQLFGSYGSFLRELRPLLAQGRPTRILDLAAGHGGFALALARAAKDEGAVLAITATDLKQEYLDLGAAAAEREGLPVRFVQQDALDLSNIEQGAHDVVICTQSLHHFPAGLVAVMFEASVRVAGRGVLFVDGCRSLVKALPLVALARVRFNDHVLAHDALVSFRRFFTPEELALLAGLGPWGDQLQAYWLPPAHCVLRLDKARAQASSLR